MKKAIQSYTLKTYVLKLLIKDAAIVIKAIPDKKGTKHLAKEPLTFIFDIFLIYRETVL